MAGTTVYVGAEVDVSPPFTVENRIGRVLEARLFAPRTVDEVEAFRERLRAAFAVAGDRCLICADWRGANLLAPPVADALVGLLRRGNRHFERSAVLLPEGSPLFALQVDRVVREAANPARRTFVAARVLCAWLGETATDAEKKRMTAFLSEGGRP
jgi:hypothetical protein